MDSFSYSMPAGLQAIPHSTLDLRPDADIDHDLLQPGPITSEKNIWFYWHQGFTKLHPYTKRVVRIWHRRFSQLGWTIRVVDRVPDSPRNVAHYLDVTDSNIFPRAFIDGRVGGDYGIQHSSDLVRFPLLLKYGGVYADVGFIQIGDLNALWERTIGDDSSDWEVLSYHENPPNEKKRGLMNYFMACRKDNAFFERCHQALLALWNLDGGRTETTGMHSHAILEGVPLLDPELTFTMDGKFYNQKESAELLSDYIIQGQVISAVMGLVDEQDGWNGPEYVAKHVYALDFMVGSQYINELTAWNGDKAFELMSRKLPEVGAEESSEQKEARNVVEQCLTKSFGFKLAHGIILKMIGPTLGSNWRDHEGSDDVPRTYAHWFRYGTLYWCQPTLPARVDIPVYAPYRTGRLIVDA